MLVLVLAAEVGLRRYEARRMPAQCQEWKNLNRLVKIARGSDVVALGDSLIKNGVLPQSVESRLGPGHRVHNLAANGGPAPASYFLLRRLIDSGHPPRAVVVDGQSLTHSVRSPMFPLPWHVLLTFPELAHLSGSLRDPGFFAEVATRKVFTSLRVRNSIRSWLAGVLSGGASGEPDDNWLALVSSERNQGCLLIPDRDPSTIPDPSRYNSGLLDLLRGLWICHAEQEQYVERLLALAEAHDIRVFWTLMPADPTLNELRERDGWYVLYARYLRDLQTRHRNLVVIDGHRAGYPPTALVDLLHLSRTGAVTFSDALGGILADRSQSARWVELPRFEPRHARELAARSSSRDLGHVLDEPIAARGDAAPAVRR
jgi:hypothetical protein